MVSYNEWVSEPEILENSEFESLPVCFFSTQCSFSDIILYQTHNIAKKQKHRWKQQYLKVKFKQFSICAQL